MYTSVFSPLLALVLGIGKFKSRNVCFIIILFLVVSFFSDVFSWSYYYLIGGSTYWIINYYQYLELIFVYSFFYLIFDKSKLILVTCLLLGIFFLLKHLEVGNQSMYGEAIAIHSLLAVSCCLLYLFRIFRNETEIFIEKDPVFLFVIGLLIFYSGGLFSWLLKSYNPVVDMNITWAFHNLSNILKNLLFAVGLWKARHASSAIQP